ncbi:MAG: hypothetical protein IKB34_08805 [Clostridia bacterium]|nr:hypothetical protein [Clostridia bacterium]
MEKRKLVLARCEKTGKQFCIEMKEVGRGWKVINFVDLTASDAERIPADAPESNLDTAPSLVECEGCGGRRVAGCTCAVRGRACSFSDRYDFQCIYCSELKMEKNGSYVIYVSSPNYDDIGQVIASMRLDSTDFDGEYDCDLLFINCGTSDEFDDRKLREFVEKGGCVYMSDLASDFLVGAFPDVLEFENDTFECCIMAEVVDPELMNVVGEEIEIEFDLPAWSRISATPGLAEHNGKVLLCIGSGEEYAGAPLMVTFKYGKGSVFYTSFHNYSQASEKEKMLLQLLLMKQIGARSNKSIKQVGDLIGLNIAVMKEKFE